MSMTRSAAASSTGRSRPQAAKPLYIHRLELPKALAPGVDRDVADPVPLATSDAGALSASRKILTICSSDNLAFFMVHSLPEGTLSQSIN